MRLLAHVLRALKHHVLEQMREAGAALCLVHRPDVIPQINGNQGQAMVFVQQHGQAVWQRVTLIGEGGHLQGLRRNELWCGLCQCSHRNRKSGGGEAQACTARKG